MGRYCYVVSSVTDIHDDGISVLVRTFGDANMAVNHYHAIKGNYITTTLEDGEGYILMRHTPNRVTLESKLNKG